MEFQMRMSMRMKMIIVLPSPTYWVVDIRHYPASLSPLALKAQSLLSPFADEETEA